MALEVGEYMPDYLKDFEDVALLCESLERQCSKFFLESDQFLNRLRLVYAITERWKSMVYTEPSFGNGGERIGILHMIVQKPTMEDYAFYLKYWLPDEKFTLSYDKEMNTFSLVIEKDTYYCKEKERMIRNLFPMNAKIVIEAP